MPSKGPKYGGIAANAAGAGDYSWSYTDGAQGEPDGSGSDMTVIQTGPVVSQFLYLRNFGFDIPEDATIDGVYARVKSKYVYKSPATPVLTTLKLHDDTGFVGDNKATFGVLGGSDVFQWDAFGASDDDWNAGLDRDKVNNANFGIGLSVTIYIETYYDYVAQYVDSFELTVYYTDAAGPSFQTKVLII